MYKDEIKEMKRKDRGSDEIEKSSQMLSSLIDDSPSKLLQRRAHPRFPTRT